LLIAHPPCTRLANSGVRWLNSPPPGKTKEQITEMAKHNSIPSVMSFLTFKLLEGNIKFSSKESIPTELEKYSDTLIKVSDKCYVDVHELYYCDSMVNQDKEYHFKKREDFEKHNLRVIMFRSDEIYQKPKVVASIVKMIAQQCEIRIGARKTELREISWQEASPFFDM